jgi:hydroxylamine oxidation protein HaoB
MKRTLPIIGALLVAGGLFFLGAVGWAFLHPAPPPYSYKLVAEGGPKEFAELGLGDSPDLAIRKYEVRTEALKEPFAVLHLGQRPSGGPVLLEWRNNTLEPVITLAPSLAETRTLAEKISQHLPAGAPVLAWWDTSRQLRFLAGTEVLFGENLVRPVLIPAAWRGREDAIETTEREFWQAPSSPQTQAEFDRYVEALLLDETAGVARLKELAGGRETHIVVHLLDAYKLGALRPDRFGIGYKDFPGGGQLHGLAKQVKVWLNERKYESYAVAPASGNEPARVFFLTDNAHANTLLARMLPFNTSNPFAMEGLQIVYQTGGYWVYRLSAGAARN